MQIFVCLSDVIKTDDRRRLSFAALERQTSQSHPITGTPCEVPVPKKTISK